MNKPHCIIGQLIQMNFLVIKLDSDNENMMINYYNNNTNLSLFRSDTVSLDIKKVQSILHRLTTTTTDIITLRLSLMTYYDYEHPFGSIYTPSRF